MKEEIPWSKMFTSHGNGPTEKGKKNQEDIYSNMGYSYLGARMDRAGNTRDG